MPLVDACARVMTSRARSGLILQGGAHLVHLRHALAEEFGLALFDFNCLRMSLTVTFGWRRRCPGWRSIFQPGLPQLNGQAGIREWIRWAVGRGRAIGNKCGGGGVWRRRVGLTGGGGTEIGTEEELGQVC